MHDLGCVCGFYIWHGGQHNSSTSAVSRLSDADIRGQHSYILLINICETLDGTISLSSPGSFRLQMHVTIPFLYVGFLGVKSLPLQADSVQPNRMSKSFTFTHCSLGQIRPQGKCNLYAINCPPVTLDFSHQDNPPRKRLACTVQGLWI